MFIGSSARFVTSLPNLDVILHFDLLYVDLLSVNTSPDYLNQLQKDVFAMIRQLGPPTFFVTITSAKSKWLLLLKCLYDINSKKLNNTFLLTN
jgi:hypothetical protein